MVSVSPESAGRGPVPLAHYAYHPRLGGRGVSADLYSDEVRWLAGPSEGRMALRDVARVHLVFQPAKFATASYDMRIEGRDGRRLVLSSASRVAVTRVSQQGPEYRAFVVAFHDAMRDQDTLNEGLGRQHPPVEWRGGYGRLRWMAMVGLGIVTLLALLVVSAMLARQGEWMFAGIILVSGGVLSWPMVEALWRNRPVSYQPAYPPACLLPAQKPA